MLLPKILNHMKLTAQKIFYTFIILLIYIGAHAQAVKPGARVTGTLLDEKSKPMGYATVSLLKVQDSSLVKGTLSSDPGIYTFERLVSCD